MGELDTKRLIDAQAQNEDPQTSYAPVTTPELDFNAARAEQAPKSLSFYFSPVAENGYYGGLNAPAHSVNSPGFKSDPMQDYLLDSKLKVGKDPSAVVQTLNQLLDKYDNDPANRDIHRKQIFRTIDTSAEQGESFKGELYQKAIALIQADPNLKARLDKVYGPGQEFNKKIEELNKDTFDSREKYLREKCPVVAEVVEPHLLSLLENQDKKEASRNFILDMFALTKGKSQDEIVTLIKTAKSKGFIPEELSDPLKAAYNKFYEAYQNEAENPYSEAIKIALSSATKGEGAECYKIIESLLMNSDSQTAGAIIASTRELKTGEDPKTQLTLALNSINEKFTELGYIEGEDQLAALLKNPDNAVYPWLAKKFESVSQDTKALAIIAVISAPTEERADIVTKLSGEPPVRTNTGPNYFPGMDSTDSAKLLNLQAVASDPEMINVLASLPGNNELKIRANCLEWAIKNKNPAVFKAIMQATPDVVAKDFDEEYSKLLDPTIRSDPTIIDGNGYLDFKKILEKKGYTTAEAAAFVSG
jgi:hypothetical protein